MRGRVAGNLNGEGKKLAERMGYHWAENTDPSVPFNGFMFNGNVVIAVKAIKIRYGPGEDCDIEKKFPDDIAEIRSLPLPPGVIRELWVRTQNERMFRRFYILPGTTAEIEENTKENYRNPHYREAYWKKAPYRVTLPLPITGRERDEVK
ncbi:MAG TPA: hypothetical protein VEI81_00645 [Methanoregula sp.]|nr:hypothetical protein [Methanoregula sp.]